MRTMQLTLACLILMVSIVVIQAQETPADRFPGPRIEARGWDPTPD